MKKRIKIITIAIIVILLVAILIIVFLPKKQERNYTKKEIIEQISNGFVDGISKGKLEDLINQDIADKTMMTGEDAYLLQTPSEKLIDDYNLNNYINLNKTYFKHLEKAIKQNYSWEFAEDVSPNQNSFLMNIKVYSYGIYLSDLEEMEQQLLANYKSKNTEEKQINEYKAKVVAMKLLDSHINDYVYNGEARSIFVDFKNIKSDETKNSLMQYLIDLAGYNNQDENIRIMVQNRQERVKSYIDDAINNQIIDKNDILKL